MMKKNMLRHSRVRLLALISVFILPLLLAIWLYLSDAYQGFISPAAANHGILLQPVQPLPEVIVSDVTTTEVNLLQQARGSWVYLHVFDSTCDLPCFAALFKSRQVRASLNQNMDRVKRIFLYVEKMQELEILREHDDAIILTYARIPEELSAVLRNPRTQDFYLLDPYGNVVLRYTPEHESRGILKDIKKLLRISRIG